MTREEKIQDEAQIACEMGIWDAGRDLDALIEALPNATAETRRNVAEQVTGLYAKIDKIREIGR